MSGPKALPNWDYVCVAGIDDWDRVTLKVLAEHDGVSPAELASHVKREQFDTRMASAWFKDAESRAIGRSEVAARRTGIRAPLQGPPTDC